MSFISKQSRALIDAVITASYKHAAAEASRNVSARERVKLRTAVVRASDELAKRIHQLEHPLPAMSFSDVKVSNLEEFSLNDARVKRDKEWEG